MTKKRNYRHRDNKTFLILNDTQITFYLCLFVLCELTRDLKSLELVVCTNVLVQLTRSLYVDTQRQDF